MWTSSVAFVHLQTGRESAQKVPSEAYLGPEKCFCACVTELLDLCVFIWFMYFLSDVIFYKSSCNLL